MRALSLVPILLVSGLAAVPPAAPVVRPGVWSWACGYAGYQGSQPEGFYVERCFHQVLVSPPPWLRGWFQVIYWRDLEVADGVFNWTEFDRNLTLAVDNGLQVQPVLYIFDCATTLPDWLGNLSKPIGFHRGSTAGKVCSAPNYRDPVFQERWRRVVQALAAHLEQLPQATRANIWAVQAVAGITGDNRPWDGVVVDPKDNITAAEWIAYSRSVAEMYLDVFTPTGIPVIANLHDGFSGQSDQGWFLRHAYEMGMRGAAIKEGGVSHWYQENGEDAVFKSESPLLLAPQPDGSYARSRGELAVEPDPTPGTYGNWAASPWWSLQALAEWGLTFGLDVWNLYAGFLGNASFAPTMDFFNRHAGHRDAAAAPAAFISFRDSLDTADVERFPEDEYGGVNATGNPDKFANSTRMVKIVAQFARRGAQLPNPGAASCKIGVKQKKAMSLLDVCYACYRGNYGRFVEQIDPRGTSVGWWQVGPRQQPYGRFARGLEHSTGRTAITVRVDPRLGGGGRAALVRVVYLDRGSGRWTLSCGGATVATVRKTATEMWKVAEANVTLAAIQSNGTELTLSSLDEEDDVFSLLEVLMDPSEASSNNLSLI